MDTETFLPEGWEERVDATRNRKYWLWTLSKPPRKSYRHPSDDSMVPGDGPVSTNSADIIPSPLSSPVPSPIMNENKENMNVTEFSLNHPETAQDAPAYTEFSEDPGDEEHPASAIIDEYLDVVSSPSAVTDFSESSEISAPRPTVEEFHAASMRQQSLVASAAANRYTPPPLPRRSASVRSAPTPAAAAPSPSLVNAVSQSLCSEASGPRSLLQATGVTKVIPTIAVKYRSELFGPNPISSETHSPSSNVSNLYTQVQYHGPQVQNQIGSVNTPSLYSQSPSKAHTSTPPQPVPLGAMPGPGQPGYAGYVPSRVTPPIPLRIQGQIQGQISTQVQLQIQGQAQVVQQNPMQQPPLQQLHFQQPSDYQLLAQYVPQQPRSNLPPYSAPLPGGIVPAPYRASTSPQSSSQYPRSLTSGMPPHSKPRPGGIVPAPYKASTSSSGVPRSSSQQRRPSSGMPPYSKPPPGGIVPASYSTIQVQSVTSNRPPLPLYQQGNQAQQLQQASRMSMSHGGYVPVSYTASQTQQPGQQPSQVHQQTQQVLPQVDVLPQSRPQTEGYITVPYNTSQIQRTGSGSPYSNPSPPGVTTSASHNTSQTQQTPIAAAQTQAHAQHQSQLVIFPQHQSHLYQAQQPQQQPSIIPLGAHETADSQTTYYIPTSYVSVPTVPNLNMSMQLQAQGQFASFHPNYSTGSGQNVESQAPKSNSSQYHGSGENTNNGSTSEAQSSRKSKFTLSNITDAINLGVSAISLYENIENAINPGSYPSASSNSSGGGSFTINVNTGNGQTQGNGSGSGQTSNNANTVSSADFVGALGNAVAAVGGLHNNNNANFNGALNGWN